MRVSKATCHLVATLVFVALVCMACGGAQKKEEFKLPGRTKLVVDSFTIEGNEAFSDEDLKEGLVTQEDPGWRASPAIQWFPVIGAEHIYFNSIEWGRDLERIVTFYKAHGYFEAKIVSENIVERPDEELVRVSVRVKEGKPTKVTKITFDGLQGTDLEQSSLLEKLPIEKDQTFNQQTYLRSKEELGDLLRRKSYAYAEVTGRVVVDPGNRSAEVFFFADPGPRSTFGEVTVEGVESVDEDQVFRATMFEEGESYDPRKLEQTQENIYDLGVFSLVKVTPATERVEFEDEEPGVTPDVEEVTGGEPQGAGSSAGGGPEGDAGQDDDGEALGITDLLNEAQETAEERTEIDPVVPVRITVKEARLWNVRVGAGASAERTRQAGHLRFDWTSRNFLGGLRKLEHFNSIGYAWAPGFFEKADHRNQGVIAESELRFTQPQFFEKLTELRIRLKFSRDVEQGFIQTSPTTSIALRRTFFRRLTAQISYNFALYVLTNVSPSLLEARGQLLRTYNLEYFEQNLLLDFTNSFLNPTDGWLIDLVVQEASTYLWNLFPVPWDKGFDYIKPVLSAEFYQPFELLTYQVLALRARLGSIYNVGREKLPPIPQRLYAGGADSMRSFGEDRLSPYTESGDAIPVGGLTKFEASIEPRFRLIKKWLDVGDLWGAIFLDTATVLGGQLYFDTESNQSDVETFDDIQKTLHFGTGLGAWWLTPVGPVRLDFAYNISNTQDDPRFRRCESEQTSCDPSEFVPVDEDPIQQQLRGFNVYISIGHTF